MAENDVVKKLESLGLNEREAKVYAILLDYQNVRVSNMSEKTGIHRPSLYIVLKSLMDKGFVVKASGNVAAYNAVAPDFAFQGALNQIKSNLENGEKSVQELTGMFRERLNLEDGKDGLEVLSTKHGSLVLDWFKKAESEILTVQRLPTPPIRQQLEMIGKIDRIERDILARGVTIRCLYSPECLADPFERKRSRNTVLAGEKARISNDLKIAWSIVDNERAAFSLRPASRRWTTYLVNDPGLVYTLRMSFEYAWDRAIPFDDYMSEFYGDDDNE